jgi:hypothetical protein
MAKQFYLAQEVSGKIYDEGYHTHVTCPAFRDTVFPTEITEEQAQKNKKCWWCDQKDSSTLNKEMQSLEGKGWS